MQSIGRDTTKRVAQDALAKLNLPADWADALTQIAEKESTFRPGVTADQGAEYGGGWGTQYAVGLMQVMPPTFSQYAEAGYDDIKNPLHNMLAAIKYIKANYGTPQNALSKWAAQGGY